MLEIGFGNGEHLLGYARTNPQTLCLGAETFKNGIAKVLRAIGAEGLTNLRLFAGDTLDLLARLPNDCLDEMFILYPDPWPKKRHHKRRLINADFLQNACLRTLKSQAELLIITDWQDYAEQIRKLTAETNFALSSPPPNELGIASRYLQKARREGRRSNAFNLTKP